MSAPGKTGGRYSRISRMHMGKLVFRSLLLLAALAEYIRERTNASFTFEAAQVRYSAVFSLVWIVYVLDMFFRFFPSGIESMGCQKQFKRNYFHVGTDILPDRKRMDRGLWAVVASWLGLNGVFGALYLVKVLDWAEMLLLCQVYAVCDMICILFFCPFQAWFMKNKCCGTCRIYNWDFAMMFTPLIFVRSWYTWSLLALSLGLLAYWEISYARWPERFDEVTNAALRCENCEEKLCRHKKHLQAFLKKHRALIRIPLPQPLEETVEKLLARKNKN